MMVGIVDVGSNSVRLNVYMVQKDSFRLLFSEKRMLGLAGHRFNKALDDKGIEKLVETLTEFKELGERIQVSSLKVFATASLRGLTNLDAILKRIKDDLDLSIDLIDGASEARLGFVGAVQNLGFKDGFVCDVGGGSFEVTYFKDSQVQEAQSLSLGSLSLFRSACKSQLFAGPDQVANMTQMVLDNLKDLKLRPVSDFDTLVGIGGTARALLKLLESQTGKRADKAIKRKEIKDWIDRLTSPSFETILLVLDTCADRIHTLLPGILILYHVMKQLKLKKMVVSSQGVREGYLIDRVMKELS